MASLVLTGDTSGQVTISAPAVAGTNTLTLQAATATNAVNTLGTAVASTSGTSIEFTSLPSWIKKITVMFSGVSTSGTSVVQIQLGSGSFTTSGYNGNTGSFTSGTPTVSTFSTGFASSSGGSAADLRYGNFTLTTLGSNIWTGTGQFATGAYFTFGTGQITLGGVLDRVRITTVNGTDTFDAGTINILYEG
jgi:hypothetical protein